jgi:peptide/nickel transport system substrate-binding protein
MKLTHLKDESSAGWMLFLVMVFLLAVCIGPAHSAEPGTITIVVAEEPPNLDPSGSISQAVGSVLINNITEALTEINYEDGSIMPRLALSWKQVDANTWHFVLRKGVKFHDGEDFNAEAVIFNIKRLYDKRIASRTRAKFFSNITLGVKAIDSHTVEIKTDKVEPLLLTLMSNLGICSPRTPLDKLTRQPIGTGPYKFAKWDTGVQITLDRFDGYWGKQPQVKKAVYVWRKESAVRAAMVEVGEADLAQSIAPQEAKRPDMDFSYLDSKTWYFRIGGGWEPPLNDRRVRMALNYAIDRNGIRGTILSKDMIPATQVIVPNIVGFNPDLKVWPYDPQMARKLLDEARKDGVPVDKEITLVGRIGYYPGSDELMEAVMTMYKAVGLNVKLKMVEVAVHGQHRYKPFPKIGPYLLQGGHDNNNGGAAFTVFYLYHCNGDVSSTCDKKLDGLIERAQAATGDERKSLWRAAFKRIQEEIIPDVMLFHNVGYCRVGKRINYKPSLATLSELQLAQITFNR